MARIRCSAAARNDLGQIYRYIREQSGSGETARRFVHDVLEIVNVIEGHRDIPALFGEGEQG